MKEYIKLLLQLLLSPRNGWEDIDKTITSAGDLTKPATMRFSASRLATSGFYPLIVITALSAFVPVLYKHVAFLSLFMDAIVTLVVFFVSYFFGNFLMSVAIEPMIEGEYDEQRCQTFSLFTLGLLALIWIITNFLPITSIVLFFLPCYVALVQWKGCEFMHVKKERIGQFMMLAILGILLPPYIFYFVFKLIF